MKPLIDILSVILQIKSSLGRLLSLSLILFIVSSIGCQQSAPRKTVLAPTSEAELFKSKCSKCHEPELALDEYRSAEVWHETIIRMKEEHNADISRKEIGLLVEYHVDRQKQEAVIFQEKCEKCHPGRIFLEKNLTTEQARAIIKRMQHKAGNTITEKDTEIIIRYHTRMHIKVLEEDLKNIPGKTIDERQGMQLFAEKCSRCHELDKALTVIKDADVWEQTIKRMQYYSKGSISDQEAKGLVDFHVTEQQREISAFRETCTRCHDDERINSRSMSEEQWLAVIKRMQQKAPELISDEKIQLLAAFFHRRELTMARIFYGKCQLCHYSRGTEQPFQGSGGDVGGVIVLGSEEFGESFQIEDVEALLSFHVQRQHRSMQLYRRNCKTCHTDEFPADRSDGTTIKRSRAEWISYIATLQDLELDKDVQEMIDSQIDYHISRQ